MCRVFPEASVTWLLFPAGHYSPAQLAMRARKWDRKMRLQDFTNPKAQYFAKQTGRTLNSRSRNYDNGPIIARSTYCFQSSCGVLCPSLWEHKAPVIRGAKQNGMCWGCKAVVEKKKEAPEKESRRQFPDVPPATTEDVKRGFSEKEKSFGVTGNWTSPILWPLKAA